MEAWLIQLVRDGLSIGVLALFIAMYIKDRGKADSNTDNAVAAIAADTPAQLVALTTQIIAVHDKMSNLERDLGRAEGQNIVLMDNIKTSEQKRDASEIVMKDKIFALEQADKSKTVLISRHEGRIAELETESKRKDEIIATKEHEIIDLKMEITRQKVTIETQETQLAQQERALQLVTRAQTLDDTIQLTEAELDSLVEPIPSAAPTTETTTELKKAG